MESKRNYQLDALKFFFTLCIFLYHARLLAPAGGLARQISDKWGWFGVHFFFIVSGMLMANSFMRHRTEQTQEPGKAAVRFVVHKFRSIAGIYFISFSFNFVIRFCIELHAHQDVSTLTTLWKLILGSVPELFLVQMSGVRQIGVNSVTWYISAMLLVMLPLYYFLCKKPDFFLHVFCPTAALMLYGFFSRWTMTTSIRTTVSVPSAAACFVPSAAFAPGLPPGHWHSGSGSISLTGSTAPS